MNLSLQTAIDLLMPVALATGLFKDLVTIQVPTGALTETGFPDGSYADVAGLVGLTAMVAPPSTARIPSNTSKTLSLQQALNAVHVLLGGFYPAVETAWRNGGRAIVNTRLYENEDILAVESDSQSTQTRMYLRVVSE